MAKGDKEYREERNQELTDYLIERALQQKDKNKKSKAEKITLGAAKQAVFLEEFENLANKVFKGKISTGKAPAKSQKKVDRVLNLIVSDTHFGSDLDPNEVSHAYGPVEEARRMAKVALETANYKRQYRDTTRLNLFLLGDLIQGHLHDPRDGAPLAHQISRAMHILINMIDFLSKEFPMGITVRCTSGNHGRRTDRHKQRATLQKFDSNETPIYVAIKAAFRASKNVTVEIPSKPYIDYEVFGMRGFMSHGDTVFRVPFAGNSINTKSIRDQINTLNSSEAKKRKKNYDLFAFGHVHTSAMVRLPGAIMITNSALVPSDSFAESIGIFETVCGQQLFESVAGYIVGDSRFIIVDEKDDKDARLDKIIKPYQGF